MFHNFFLLIAIIPLILAQTPQKCQTPKTPDDAITGNQGNIPNLQTGMKIVKKTDLNPRFTSFNVTFNKTIHHSQISVAIHNINSFKPKNVIDFQVSAVNYGTYFQGMIIVEMESEWSQIGVSYIVSGRQDFIVGNFIPDNNRLINLKQNSRQITISTILNTQRQIPRYSWILMPFISGIRTYEKDFSLHFVDRNLNSISKELSFTLKINVKKYCVEFLSISYLIFHNRNDLEVISLYSVNYLGDTFHGVSDVSSNSLLFSDRNITSGPLKNSAGSDQYFNQMFGLHGVLVQVESKFDHGLLTTTDSTHNTLKHQYRCISKKKCSGLGGNIYYQQNSIYDITSICTICQKNSKFNESQKRCQCKLGYTMVEDECIPTSSLCGIHQIYNQHLKKCICAKLFVNISGRCISVFSLCKSTEIYFKGKCIRIIFNKEASPCPSGYVVIEKKCQKIKVCKYPMKLNRTVNQCQCYQGYTFINGKCQSKCGENQRVEEGQCRCLPNYGRTSEEKCQPCHLKAYSNKDKCYCIRNHEGDGFNCTIIGSQQQIASGSLTGAAPGGSIRVP